MNRLSEIRARLEEDNPYRPHLRGKVGCRRADDWNLQQTRDLRDLLAVVDTVWDAHADHADQSYRKTCATCAVLAPLISPSITTTSRCCRDNVPHAGGFRQEDERWSCPECGAEWIHVIEESEGAWWQRALDDRRDVS